MTSIACRLALPRSPGRTAGTASCEPDRAADVDERQPARRRLDALPPTGSRSFSHADHARPPRARRRTVRCPAGRRRGPGPGSSSARRRPTPAAPTPRRAYPPRQGRSGDVNRPQRAGEHSCCSVEDTVALRARKSPGPERVGLSRGRPGQRPGGGGVRPPAQTAVDDLGWLFRESCGLGEPTGSLCSRRVKALRSGPADDSPLAPARCWLWPDGFVRPVGTLAGPASRHAP